MRGLARAQQLAKLMKQEAHTMGDGEREQMYLVFTAGPDADQPLPPAFQSELKSRHAKVLELCRFFWSCLASPYVGPVRDEQRNV